MNDFPLPASFVQRIVTQLPDADVLFRQLDDEAATSIRLHPIKQQFADELPQGKEVPWNIHGRYLSERPKFSHDPSYHAGLYYPMEASSMFLSFVLQEIQLPEDALLLDLCAAPGGKSLILKDAFPEQLLVSNEIDAKRVHVLKENAIRWGTENHVIIQSDAPRLQRSDLQFDLILVDAPCSGEGLFRKDKKSRTEWTAEKAAGCAVRQSVILDDVVPMMADGGWLIYSTCTFNPDENMQQVNRLVDEFGLESVPLKIDSTWGIETLDNGRGYQFWPHRVAGEGFFISLLRKRGESEQKELPIGKVKNESFPFLPFMDFSESIIQKWEQTYVVFSTQELGVVKALTGHGNIVKKGLTLGELKGKDFLPAHDLSANPKVKDFPNRMTLSQTEALDYLRGNALQLDCPNGPVLLTFNGLGMGFGKSNGRRVNNLLPKHLRIF
jgi:16S rRNA C967 or C1407 C5-methylase (RsmB/RsmF family)/NOL1/NOP2/fmu family ribosome biogenesis protein